MIQKKKQIRQISPNIRLHIENENIHKIYKMTIFKVLEMFFCFFLSVQSLNAVKEATVLANWSYC